MATRYARRKLGTRSKVYFPNFPLYVHSGGNKAAATKQVVLRSAPQWGKLDVKQFLSSVYDVKVKKVNSLNVEGKKKWNRGRVGFLKRKDYKKFYVRMEQSALPEDMLEEGEDE